MLCAGLDSVLRPHDSVLDVGAGVGGLTFELLERTSGPATLVEASRAYLRAAGAEADRRGLSGRVRCLDGDFVEISVRVPAADVVVMDRVVCCYPEFEPLLAVALPHARRVFAHAYPRDRWYVRWETRFENSVRRLRASAFRTFVHPPHALHALAVQHGFRLHSERRSRVWAVEVWQRAA
jgi:magnesium-protoporphyrin O-methyltransferase